MEFDARKGVVVKDKLQTTNPDIYAVGDVASKYQFTHMADFMARLVIKNALFFGRDKVSDLPGSLGNLHRSGSSSCRTLRERSQGTQYPLYHLET